MDTLVLDSRWLPVDVISWRKAMNHLAASEVKRHVRVVSEYENRSVRSATRAFALPAVIQLLPGLRADGRWTDRVVKRARQVRFSRQSVFARDGGRCLYCGVAVTRESFSFDHVLPRAQGGLTSWENIVTACLPCNQTKGGRTPEQAGMKLLARPVRPQPGAGLTGFREGMPEEWRAFLPEGRDGRASALYWSARLRAR